MAKNSSSNIHDIISKSKDAIVNEWVKLQFAALSRKDAVSESDLQEQSKQFLKIFNDTFSKMTSFEKITGADWNEAKDFLNRISRARAKQGFTPSETAVFVFSAKQPIFNKLRAEISDAETIATAVVNITSVLDQLGLYTTEVYMKSREEIIQRQQQEMMELSTPVVRLWENILALPLIGTLDSARTQVVMETLLQEIVETGASIAIIDITGVPTVDTLVAQHLLKTVAAARLMGADCIISGIRPQIAQTIVHLGVELNDVITKATLADAFKIALQRTNCRIVTTKN